MILQTSTVIKIIKKSGSDFQHSGKHFTLPLVQFRLLFFAK